MDTKTRPAARPNQVMGSDELRVGQQYNFFTKAMPHKPYVIQIRGIGTDRVKAKVIESSSGGAGHECLHKLGVSSNQTGGWSIHNYLTRVS